MAIYGRGYSTLDLTRDFQSEKRLCLIEGIDRLPESEHKREILALDQSHCGVFDYLRHQFRKWDRMYAKRAFVHWCVGSGIPDECARAARLDMGEMIKSISDSDFFQKYE